MGEKAFKIARYKTLSVNEEVLLEKVNKDKYFQKYKGNLFCPNDKCTARIKYVVKKNGLLTYFSSINIYEHIAGCPYYFKNSKYDTDEKINKIFSDNHVNGALKRQLKKYGTVETKKYDVNNLKFNNRKKKKRNEPIIQTYSCEFIDDNLIGNVICVIGVVESIKIIKTNVPMHAYINFNRKDKNIKLLIKSGLFLNDPSLEKSILKMQNLFKTKRINTDFICACVGRIDKVENGINVVPPKLSFIRTAIKYN